VLEYIRNLQRSKNKQEVKGVDEIGLNVNDQETETENVQSDTMVDIKFKDFDYIDNDSNEIELQVKRLEVKY
jgi:uncharacterized protein YdeI (BOF family)